MDKLKGLDSSNFMLRHNLLYHANEHPMDNSYVWYPTKFHTKAIDRQVGEAIEIKKAMDTPGVLLMNAKTEYSRCVLPGISPVPSKEDEKEDNKVKDLIAILRKQKDQHMQADLGQEQIDRHLGRSGELPTPVNAQIPSGAQVESSISQVSNLVFAEQPHQFAPACNAEEATGDMEEQTGADRLERETGSQEVADTSGEAEADSLGEETGSLEVAGEAGAGLEDEVGRQTGGESEASDAEEGARGEARADTSGLADADRLVETKSLEVAEGAGSGLEGEAGRQTGDEGEAVKQTEAGGEEGGRKGGKTLLNGLYDLEAGKVHCTCIRRKWGFCRHIRTLAGGTVTLRLLESREVGKEEGGKGSWQRQAKLRLIHLGGGREEEGRVEAELP